MKDLGLRRRSAPLRAVYSPAHLAPAPSPLAGDGGSEGRSKGTFKRTYDGSQQQYLMPG
jgi:hypothetical protein